MISLGGHEWDCRRTDAPLRTTEIRNPFDLAVMMELSLHEELDVAWRGPTNPQQAIICDQISWELEGVYARSRPRPYDLG